MPSAELTSTKAPRESAADLQAPCSRNLDIVAGVHLAGYEALAHPQAAAPSGTSPARPYAPWCT